MLPPPLEGLALHLLPPSQDRFSPALRQRGRSPRPAASCGSHRLTVSTQLFTEPRPYCANSWAKVFGIIAAQSALFSGVQWKQIVPICFDSPFKDCQTGSKACPGFGVKTHRRLVTTGLRTGRGATMTIPCRRNRARSPSHGPPVTRWLGRNMRDR